MTVTHKLHNKKNAEAVDLPIAGLLQDLKQRGLLDDTLVFWGGEFGRTPTSQGTNGREHHPHGYSIWLAGGGVKGGFVHGATDELGFHAVEHPHYVTDIHATVLHLQEPGKRLPFHHGQAGTGEAGERADDHHNDHQTGDGE